MRINNVEIPSIDTASSPISYNETRWKYRQKARTGGETRCSVHTVGTYISKKNICPKCGQESSIKVEHLYSECGSCGKTFFTSRIR
jgi:ribosomal protein S27AE